MRRFLLLVLLVVGMNMLTFRWRRWKSEIRSMANALIALAVGYVGTAIVIWLAVWFFGRATGSNPLGSDAAGPFSLLTSGQWTERPLVQMISAIVGLLAALVVRVRDAAKQGRK
jgi:multisubunit Na+/H+ antiporter MnhB subunit